MKEQLLDAINAALEKAEKEGAIECKITLEFTITREKAALVKHETSD